MCGVMQRDYLERTCANETKDTELDILSITRSTNSRFIQCLVAKECQNYMDDTKDIMQELMDGGIDNIKVNAMQILI